MANSLRKNHAFSVIAGSRVARLLLAVLVVLCYDLQQAAAQTVDVLHITGNGSYTINFNNDTVSLNVDQIENTSTTYTSGTLQLELWATNTPYTGADITGYQVATYRLGQLPPRTFYSSISASNISIGSRPPQGAYYATLLLTEYSDTCTSSDKFCIEDYVNFSSPMNVPARVTVSPDINEEGGGGILDPLLLVLGSGVLMLRHLKPRSTTSSRRSVTTSVAR